MQYMYQISSTHAGGGRESNCERASLAALWRGWLCGRVGIGHFFLQEEPLLVATAAARRQAIFWGFENKLALFCRVLRV